MNMPMIARSKRASPNVAFLSTYVPRECGIATFTANLVEGLPDSDPVRVVALDGNGPRLTYPKVVRQRIRASERAAYSRLAAQLEEAGVDIVSVQHEYGIFGGPSGMYLLDFLDSLNLPVVTTLHTILTRPTPLQRRVLQRIGDRSERLVSMSQRGRVLLRDVYGIPPGSIEVIPHGVPAFGTVNSAEAKARLGLDGLVILSFGLLGPHKRLELVIDALARIAHRAPDARLAIVGRTHPEIRRKWGESYRQSLVDQAARLGIGDRLVFVDRFLDNAELGDWLAASDVFVTPYSNAQQITSGTLAYALAAGTAIVSTPYEHAVELLGEGRGVLVPFNDVDRLAEALDRLLTDDVEREAIQSRARAHGRSFTWPQVAARYAELFAQILSSDELAMPAAALRPLPVASVPQVGVMTPAAAVGYGNGHPLAGLAIPTPFREARSAEPARPIGRGGRSLPGPAEMPTGVRRHLESMADEIGIFQFSSAGRPDRAFGHCTDDVARCLRVDLRHAERALNPKVANAIRRDVVFLREAFDPTTGRFRNFRGSDGHWLDAPGSEDAHARAFRALGEAMTGAADRVVAASARRLFAQALPEARQLRHMRPIAAAILGADAALADPASAPEAWELLELLAERLADPITNARESDPTWPWPDSVVTYENGIVPEALIAAGLRLGRPALVGLGTDVLGWLLEAQTAPGGWLRSIGNDGWWRRGGHPARWDQQPVEPASLLFAAAAAYEATGNARWLAEADRCARWFLGENDGRIVLADPARGACRDGLLPHGPNTNEGAESTLLWLLVSERVADLRQAGSSSRRRPGRGHALMYSSTDDSGAEEKATLESAAP